MINLFIPDRKRWLIKFPGMGRVGIEWERYGSCLNLANQMFQTNLRASLFRKGKYEGTVDLGSGLVTNVGAIALANEAITLASPSGARINTLFLANQHFTGTGATAAAATDYKIQTISTNGGQTAVAGTQTTATSSTGAVPKYQTVATVAYTGTEAVTEWGLHTSSTRTSTTGSPFTAATATTWTDTGSAQTASSSTVQGLQQTIVEPGTTTVWGFNQTNTTHVATLWNNGTTGWWKQSDSTAGSTPGNTETFTIRPVMWDHKVFSAINVNNGDSIQFTYVLTVSSGG